MILNHIENQNRNQRNRVEFYMITIRARNKSRTLDRTKSLVVSLVSRAFATVSVQLCRWFAGPSGRRAITQIRHPGHNRSFNLSATHLLVLLVLVPPTSSIQQAWRFHYFWNAVGKFMLCSDCRSDSYHTILIFNEVLINYFFTV